MLKYVSIIGAGTMGNGIAHVFAQNGFTTSLIDVDQQKLDKAISIIEKNLDRQLSKATITDEVKRQTLGNITIYTNLVEGIQKAGLIIEAATENVELKLKIFKQLGEFAPPDCILATNTSSISITKIAASTGRESQVIGMHFMNPVPIMKLVEVINGYATDKKTTEIIVDLSKQLNKIPCVVNDYPGFIANRILMPMINEAIYSLYENIASVAEIDTIMKLGMAHPMGPLQLADFIGLDVCLNILRVMQDGFGNPKYAPCPLLVNMVAAGKLGVKTNEGFYKYETGKKELMVSQQFK